MRGFGMPLLASKHSRPLLTLSLNLGSERLASGGTFQVGLIPPATQTVFSKIVAEGFMSLNLLGKSTSERAVFCFAGSFRLAFKLLSSFTVQSFWEAVLFVVQPPMICRKSWQMTTAGLNSLNRSSLAERFSILMALRQASLSWKQWMSPLLRLSSLFRFISPPTQYRYWFLVLFSIVQAQEAPLRYFIYQVELTRLYGTTSSLRLIKMRPMKKPKQKFFLPSWRFLRFFEASLSFYTKTRGWIYFLNCQSSGVRCWLSSLLCSLASTSLLHYPSNITRSQLTVESLSYVYKSRQFRYYLAKTLSVSLWVLIWPDNSPCEFVLSWILAISDSYRFFSLSTQRMRVSTDESGLSIYMSSQPDIILSLQRQRSSFGSSRNTQPTCLHLMDLIGMQSHPCTCPDVAGFSGWMKLKGWGPKLQFDWYGNEEDVY